METAQSHEGVIQDAEVFGGLSTGENVPDPVEDDLDDLDDMLDEFSATKIDKPKDISKKLEPSRVGELQEANPSDEAASEFSKKLQEQMAALMSSVDESPEMKIEIEAMMKELGTAADPGADVEQQNHLKNGLGEKSATPSTEEPFQESIRKTMERLQASGKQATAAAQAEDSDDMIAQILREMQSGGLEGASDDEGFDKMLIGIMENLTNKAILYGPMKELHDKYPEWMHKNKSLINAQDLKRYEKQQRLVGEIVGRFEMKGYSDDKAEDREFIVDRMQEMQAAGSPPADLVGDLNAAQEATGDIDSDCPQQ